MSISIITPTGDRQKSFDILTKCISNQTYTGDVQWIVVDDCEIATNIPKKVSGVGEILHVRPEPYWDGTHHTLKRNLLSGLERATGDLVVVMEDDDWYNSRWLDTVSTWLESHSLVGEGDSHYYNISNGTGKILKSRGHASLCATAFNSDILGEVRAIVENTNRAIDMTIWKKLRSKGRVYPWSGMVVGIKGGEGRGGIGIGHSLVGERFPLTKWIPNAEEYYPNNIC